MTVKTPHQGCSGRNDDNNDDDDDDDNDNYNENFI